MAKPEPADHLIWQSTSVGGKRVNYGAAGDGVPVLFLHGWALGGHTYKRALKRLVRLGCRVYAPALPGFGRSDSLPAGSELGAYAEWADLFLAGLGVDEPLLVLGHSFGGAVATKFAHQFPHRVSYLVLINSIGGATWCSSGGKERSMAERPLWDWAVNFPKDLLLTRSAIPTLTAILEDAAPNFACNPLGVWRSAGLARRADLTAELTGLRERGIPVRVLWGEGDSIIPRASFEALCSAVGADGEVVRGRHSWLLADPDAFGEALAGVVAAAGDGRADPLRGHARAG